MEFTDEELTNEVWKDIPDYEGFYQASSLGRIRSLDRDNVWNGKAFYKNNGRILKQTGHSGGYLKVSITMPGERTKFHYIHRLVASAFFGKSNLVVNHKDENKHNNKIENLEYMTNVENILYGTGQVRSKAAQHRTPIESYDLETGKTIERFESQKEAQRHGYDQKCIWNCCNGKSKSHKGFGWRYAA